ncbi:MAG: DegT/DnrJ/EryC1/StrS family aminotransferase, partial [Candidatus Hydrothermae bacterium]|nr:DegT/DnrJ/EryC1/StrS family aminotransferase [Candidatus Hydrothermae bacterium]
AAGALADIAVYAFYPNKQITTGEGGMVVTDREAWAQTLRALHNQGRVRGGRWLLHDLLGYNYRMDELSAALGEAQMRRLEEMRILRRQVFERYDDALRDLPRVQRPTAAPWADVHWFVYVIRVPADLRDRVMETLARAGIETRPYFDPPIHLQPVHRERLARYAGRLPVAEQVSREVVALPFYNHLTADMQEEVVAVLRKALDL